MRRTFLLLALPLCGLSFVTVSAQETTVSAGLNNQMSWSALKSLVDQANGNAKTSLTLASAIRDCGIKDMIYSPGTSGADANGCKKIFDPKELMVKTGAVALGPCGSGAHSCAPDSRTTERLCQQGGYSYATGTSVKGYSSPKNNWIGRWTGSGWHVFNAREANSFLLSLTCQTITWK